MSVIIRELSRFKNYFYENRLTFMVTFIGGLLVHIYKFVNTIIGHDSLYNFYSSQNMIGSGRYLLGIFCSPTSFFNLPWVNGIASVLLISLSAVLIVDILHIDNKLLASLTGLILVTFPAITETFFFEFTADGYMWAMLLCTLSVKLTLIKEKAAPLGIVASIFLIAITCAIYQAYVSFSLLLLIVYFINDVFSEKRASKKYLKWILLQLFIYVSALILYLVVWKALMFCLGMTSTSYYGINSMGSTFSVVEAVKAVIYNTFIFLFQWNIFEYGLTMYSFINILTVICICTVFIISVVRSRIYKNIVNLILVIGAFFLIPFSASVWCLANPSLVYSPRMYQSMALVYILLLVLSSKDIKRYFKTLITVLMMVFVFNNAITANLYYYYMNLSNDRAKYTATELSTRIHLLDDGDVKYIMIVGSLPDFESSEYLDNSRLRSLGALNNEVDRNLLSDNNSIYLFMSYYYDFSLAFYTENNVDLPQIGKFESNFPSTNDYAYHFPYIRYSDLSDKQRDDIQNMRIWPHKDSVKKSGDVVIVKLSE